MNSPEKNKVALVSKMQAENYFEKGNFGRAFAHVLLALKLCPNWKNNLKQLFTTSLCNWGEELETKERYSDLFNCYEQALEVFPENEEVTSNLGAHLLRLGHLDVASHYFEKALEVRPEYLPAFRNLQTVSNLLVERWHFRMLNDSHRNEAYREAIFKKVKQGFDYVLDIGTGTGLLSYFAVASEAKETYACDYSRTMINIAEKVANSNSTGSDIKFICKHSNDLIIPDDIPKRLSLVVTETMDAGLFGEHLIQTLIHAWNYLLLPPLAPNTLIPPVPCIMCRDTKPIRDSRQNGIVVPFGSRLWIAAVESDKIAKTYRHCADKRNLINYLQFPFLLVHNLDEPYDTENLNESVNSYRLLSEPTDCFYVNFNDPNNLQEFMDGKYDDVVHKIKILENGNLDCFVIWFDLYLDEDIMLSSSPLVDKTVNFLSWDQAVFMCRGELVATKDNIIEVKVKTFGGKLSIDTCDVEKQCTSYYTNEILNVSQDIVRYLNNSSLIKVLDSIVDSLNKVNAILDLSPFPLLGLNLLKCTTNIEMCVFVAKSSSDVEVVHKLAAANEIDLNKFQCTVGIDYENLSTPLTDYKFNIIVLDLIDSTGELKENCISQLPKLRHLLKPNGRFLPEKICVWGQLVHCEWLKVSTEVLNEGIIEKYNIAKFINKHKTNYQPDLRTASIKHDALSDEFLLLELSIDDFLQNDYKSFHHNIRITHSGVVTALFYWFQYSLDGNCGNTLSSKHEDSHTNQVAVMTKLERRVTPSDCVTVAGKYEDISFMFTFQ